MYLLRELILKDLPSNAMRISAIYLIPKFLIKFSDYQAKYL